MPLGSLNSRMQILKKNNNNNDTANGHILYLSGTPPETDLDFVAACEQRAEHFWSGIKVKDL